MSAVVTELERTLPGPPSLVWKIVTDWERQDLWQLEASDFVVVTPHREGLGVEAEATIHVGGIRTRDRVRVVVWDPERHLAIEHLGWVGGRGDLWMTPRNGGTALRWREELHPPWGLVGVLGLRLYRPLLLRAFRRDLDALEGLVSQRAT
jgi:hypothetical protein